jgi:hypothetical protein
MYAEFCATVDTTEASKLRIRNFNMLIITNMRQCGTLSYKKLRYYKSVEPNFEK